MQQFIVLFFICGITWNIPAQSIQHLYLANDDHTDYMWTGNEVEYDSAFVKMLDYYLLQIDATKNNAPDFQTRFNCDGSYWLHIYEKYRSPAQFNRLVSALRSGHISSPLNTLVSTYGAQPTEAVLRGMYYAGQMERRLGLRFPLAVAMENQTLPLGLSSLWAGSGAKYSWRGVCGCASRLPNTQLAQRQHQLYQYRGLDGQGLIMKWYSLKGDNRSLGGYGEARQDKELKDATHSLAQTITELSKLCESNPTTYPFKIAGAFGYGWDDLDTYVAPAFVAAAQAGTTPQRKVRVSNEVDFFEDVQHSYPNLPHESLAYGNEWDTYCASMNETSAQVRRATEKLRSAEALSTLVALQDKTFGLSLQNLRNRAWEGFGLYWEHDWTADGPVKPQERAAWQIRVQQQITTYVDTLFNLARTRLGGQLAKSKLPRFYVFNPLSWVRNDVADLEYTGTYPVKVVEVSTGQEVSSQLIQQNGQQFLRIWAENIPSVGYKVFEIQPGVPKIQMAAAIVNGEVIQNQFYRIHLRKSGVISELYDSLAKRQLVQATEGRYLNDLGTTQLDEGENLVIENAGPVSVTLKAISKLPLQHSVRLTLYKNSSRIEIQNDIQENFQDLKTWTFSTALNQPNTHHEELGAILSAKKQTRGGHYAAQNARYDWLTFNHFADLSEANYGLTLSNLDCSFFKLGKSSPDSLWEQSAQLNALAGGQTDGPKLGIPAQNGAKDLRYHFALRSHQQAFDPTEAMKFALEHQNPLVTAMLTGDRTSKTTQLSYSLLNIKDPAVLLWAIKPAEEGMKQGLITRFWNLHNGVKTPNIHFAKPIQQLWESTHLETNLAKLSPRKGTLSEAFQAQQLKTFRCWLR